MRQTPPKIGKPWRGALHEGIGALLCTALFSGAPVVFADDQAWQTLSQLAIPKDTPTGFSETSKTRLQRRAKIQSGELWLASDNTLVMSVEHPRAELRKISETQLSIERGGKTRSLTLDPARGAHQLPLIIADLLSGDTARLKDAFRVAPTAENALAQNTNQDTTQAATQAASWSWRLVPVDNALKEQLTALTLAGEDSRLVTLRTERGASYQEITILAEPDNDK